MGEISVTRRSEPGAEVIAVTGQVDIYTAPALREALHGAVAAGNGNVVVDMAGVEWLDSTGLGVLVGALKKARARDGLVVIAACPERIGRQFKITGLAKVFGLHATVADALAALAGSEAAR